MTIILKSIVRIIIVVCFVVTMHSVIWADDTLSFQLVIESEVIGQIEPLYFRLVITNTTSQDIKELLPWDDYNVTVVEFRPSDKSDWRKLEIPRLNLTMEKVPVGGLRPFELRAGESRTMKLSVLYDPGLSYLKEKYIYYFSKPGEYFLRANYKAADDKMIRSGEAEFRVQEYQGADAEAFEWIKNLAIPHFIYDFEIYADNNAHNTDDDAYELIKHYPTSRFAALSKLYLVRCYKYGLRLSKSENAHPDLNKAAELAQELANSKDADIQKSAEEILAEIKRARSSGKGLKKK